MDLVTLVLTLLFAFTLLQALISVSRLRKKLPPGPTPLPIIGNLHLILGSQPHQALTKLAKTYGPIMSLRLGQITTIVISSPDIAKEVLQKQDLAFSNRFVPNALVHAHADNTYPVVWQPVASRWRILRKILNTNIFNSSSLDNSQHLRSRKIEELIAYCRNSSQTGEAVDVGRAAFRTTMNLLSYTIFSQDLADPYSDSGKEFKDMVGEILALGAKPNLVDFFPVLDKIDPQGIRRKMVVYAHRMLKFFGGLINERLEQKKTHGTVTDDVLDVLLRASEEHPEEIDTTQIQATCMELFTAGTDTTSSTVEWAMAELFKHPETMKKAKEELEQVIGRGKPITEADITSLPYLRCIVKETLRIHPPAPFLIPRKVDQDVELGEYIVPKGSQIFINVWATGRDSNVWKNPLTFKPERFWESEIDFRGRCFEFIPFGAGRRICPGLPLAVRMVPLMVGSLLNCFEWELEGGMTSDQLDMEEKFGIALQKADPLRVIPVPL